MEKVINSYECLYILKPDLSEEEVKAAVDKYSALIADNGTVENVDVWGKRRLAYPIAKCTEGTYVIVSFKSEASLPAEIRRVLGIDDSVLRVMVIAVDEKKKAAAAAAATAAAAKAKEEAPAVAENDEAAE